MTPINKLHIAIVQYSPVWLDVDFNLKFLSEIEWQPHSQLVILPEMFATGFCMQPQLIAQNGTKITEWMKKFSIQHQKAICGSVAIEENGKFYNRLYFFYAGELIGTYDKRHLFSYSGENEKYTAGNTVEIISFLGWKICPQICYDLRFPVWFRNVQNYDILLNVANWPDSRIQIWKRLLQARSIENMAYTVGCNRIGEDANGLFYNGQSKVYFPSLEPVKLHSENNVLYTELDQEKLQEYRNKYPFLQDQDRFKLD